MWTWTCGCMQLGLLPSLHHVTLRHALVSTLLVAPSLEACRPECSRGRHGHVSGLSLDMQSYITCYVWCYAFRPCLGSIRPLIHSGPFPTGYTHPGVMSIMSSNEMRSNLTCHSVMSKLLLHDGTPAQACCDRLAFACVHWQGCVM